MKNYETAPATIDFLFKYFPEYTEFELGNLIHNSDLPPEEKELAEDNYAVEEMLVKSFKYAEYSRGEYMYRLTDTGRKAKKAGGHFAYLKKLEEKEARSEIIERLEFDKLQDEVYNLKKIVEDYDSSKRRTIRSEWVSIFAVVVTLLGLMLQWLCNKPG